MLWFNYLQTIPKTHRYSLGIRVDCLFVEVIETLAVAAFLPKPEKSPLVRFAIRKLDTAKILLMILWETGSLDNKKYITLSELLDEIGRNLGGWDGQLNKKQNSSVSAATEEK